MDYVFIVWGLFSLYYFIRFWLIMDADERWNFENIMTVISVSLVPPVAYFILHLVTKNEKIRKARYQFDLKEEDFW